MTITPWIHNGQIKDPVGRRTHKTNNKENTHYKFGKGSAGAAITQIATWSNILLRNTILEIEVFNIQMTLRTTGSLTKQDQSTP